MKDNKPDKKSYEQLSESIQKENVIVVNKESFDAFMAPIIKRNDEGKWYSSADYADLDAVLDAFEKEIAESVSK